MGNLAAKSLFQNVFQASYNVKRRKAYFYTICFIQPLKVRHLCYHLWEKQQPLCRCCFSF